MMRTILLTQIASTLALAGLIWTIQVVHYPLFDMAGRDTFTTFHHRHSTLITWVVGPLMLAEAASALGLVLWRPPQVPSAVAWAGLGLVAVIWLSTAFLQVPAHNVLARGFDAEAHRLLVTSNWLRTWAWTARAGLVLWLASRFMKPEI